MHQAGCQHLAHGDRRRRSGERGRHQQPPAHVEVLRIDFFLGRDDVHRLERHAADRTAARLIAHDLRVHGAGPPSPRPGLAGLDGGRRFGMMAAVVFVAVWMCVRFGHGGSFFVTHADARPPELLHGTLRRRATGAVEAVVLGADAAGLQEPLRAVPAASQSPRNDATGSTVTARRAGSRLAARATTSSTVAARR